MIGAVCLWRNAGVTSASRVEAERATAPGASVDAAVAVVADLLATEPRDPRPTSSVGVARLRAAGRCTAGGQAARCTFKKVSTKH